MWLYPYMIYARARVLFCSYLKWELSHIYKAIETYPKLLNVVSGEKCVHIYVH